MGGDVAKALPALTVRPKRMHGECFLIPTHFGNLTLDVHEDRATGEPVEIIASAGAAGSDLMADAVALGMAVSVPPAGAKRRARTRTPGVRCRQVPQHRWREGG